MTRARSHLKLPAPFEAFFGQKPDEQLLISFSEILFVSRALETTKGG
jgi:hypothetical protein